MANHPFDWGAYLAGLTNESNWEVEELTGGAANYTVRIKRRDSVSDVREAPKSGHSKIPNRDFFYLHESFVMKQAPPFLAKFPTISFSAQRQWIEAESLRVLHPRPDDTFKYLGNVVKCNPCIRIPELLHHDSANHVLVQSDLGPLPNLYEVLVSPETSIQVASTLGEIIGRFLADMHGSLVEDSKHLSLTFQNPDADRVMVDVITLATKFMEEAGISDFELLGQHAIDHWASRKRTAFGQGDLWFGTLLIDTDNSFRSGVDNSRVTVGICDWEFAGPNDPAADIAQLGCYIHLLAMSPLTTPARLVVVMAFAEALYATYFASLELPTGQDFVKSLLIMHGWEMINAATWNARQDMWCVCEGQGVRCSHIRTMVEEGAKFLRAAGSADNTEDFNWPVLDGIAWSRFLPLRSLTRA